MVDDQASGTEGAAASSSSDGPSATGAAVTTATDPGTTGDVDPATGDGPTSTKGGDEGTTTVDPAGTTGTDSEDTSSSGDQGCADDSECESWMICEEVCADAGHVVYLNFDAEGSLVYDSDSPSDAHLNRHACEFVGSGTPDEGYGDGPKRADVFAGVKAFLAPYRIAVTDERPPEAVDYSMIVFAPGPNANAVSCNGGGIDCDDENPRDVSIFHLNEGDTLETVVHTRFLTASILRHTGLASTEDNTDILYPFLGEGAGVIQDACVEVRTSSPFCGIDSGCGTIYEQNAHEWLAAKWGLR